MKWRMTQLQRSEQFPRIPSMVCVKRVMPIMRKPLAILSVHSHWYLSRELVSVWEHQVWTACIMSIEIQYSPLILRSHLENFALCFSATSSLKRVQCITLKEHLKCRITCWRHSMLSLHSSQIHEPGISVTSIFSGKGNTERFHICWDLLQRAELRTLETH